MRIALSAPSVFLRLRVDGRVAFEVPSHGSLAERAHAVLRRSVGRAARITGDASREGTVSVEVYLAPFEDAVQSSRRVHLLVNRRVVRDRGILSALQVGLADRVGQGRYPQAVVAIELPPADVDVNVHPQKSEVRLLRPAEIHAAIRHAVARAASLQPVTVDARRYAVEASIPIEAREEEVEYGEERGRAFELVREMAGGVAFDAEPAASRVVPSFVGAVPGGYLAFADPTGLLLVDQHVGSALLAVAVPAAGAPLSTPIPVEPSAHEATLLRLGFAIERGLLRTAPAWADPPDVALRELLSAADDGGVDELSERAATLSALRPTQSLTAEEATRLFEALRVLERDGIITSMGDACFRGRRLCTRLTRSELARRFAE